MKNLNKEKGWELLDLLMEVETKYAEFLDLLIVNEDADIALDDTTLVMDPALALGNLMGSLTKVYGITLEEFNTRAGNRGSPQARVLDGDELILWGRRQYGK